MEKLRKKYASKFATAKDRIRTAEERVDRERSQARDSMMQSVVSIGTSVLSAMMGRKLASVSNVSRAGSAAKSVGRASKQRSDIGRAEENVEAMQEKLANLEAEFDEALEELKEEYAPEALELEELPLRPRKSDIAVETLALVWAPWIVDSDGIAEPGYTLT